MNFLNIKKIIAKYTVNKKMLCYILIFLIGFFLLVIPEKNGKETVNTSIEDEADANIMQEKRLEELLETVDGIQKCKVMICFLDNGVKEYYNDESEDRDENSIRAEKKMVITRDKDMEKPVIKREKSPEIKGVSVVVDCKKRGMEEMIYNITAKALGTDIHKIEVIINDRSR